MHSRLGLPDLLLATLAQFASACREPNAVQPKPGAASASASRLFDKEAANQYEEPLLVAQLAAQQLQACVSSLRPEGQNQVCDWLRTCLHGGAEMVQGQVGTVLLC